METLINEKQLSEKLQLSLACLRLVETLRNRTTLYQGWSSGPIPSGGH